MFHTWSVFWTPIHSADGVVEPAKMKKPVMFIAQEYSNAFDKKLDVKESILLIWRRWNSTIQPSSNNLMLHLHLKLNMHQHSLTWPDIDLIVNSFNNSLCTFLIHAFFNLFYQIYVYQRRFYGWDDIYEGWLWICLINVHRIF